LAVKKKQPTAKEGGNGNFRMCKPNYRFIVWPGMLAVGSAGLWWSVISRASCRSCLCCNTSLSRRISLIMWGFLRPRFPPTFVFTFSPSESINSDYGHGVKTTVLKMILWFLMANDALLLGPRLPFQDQVNYMPRWHHGKWVRVGLLRTRWTIWAAWRWWLASGPIRCYIRRVRWASVRRGWRPVTRQLLPYDAGSDPLRMSSLSSVRRPVPWCRGNVIQQTISISSAEAAWEAVKMAPVRRIASASAKYQSREATQQH